jgi:hypothetical protein
MADYLIARYDGRVPLGVRAWTPIGQWLIIAAIRLDLHHYRC